MRAFVVLRTSRTSIPSNGLTKELVPESASKTQYLTLVTKNVECNDWGELEVIEL